MMTSVVSAIRRAMSTAPNRYSGSHDVTDHPAAVASALKLAGPSAHPRMRRRKSSEERSNIRRYSSNDRPHGTTPSNVNMGTDAPPRRPAAAHTLYGSSDAT